MNLQGKKIPLQMGCFSFRRGDVVWARAVYPHSWCPALVLRTDLFGVLVSFFGSDPLPRYFLESEVCSFEHNFPSMIDTVDSCNAVLDRALILLGRRAALSLKCPCLKPTQHGAEGKALLGVGWESKRQALEATNRFLPAEALRFVFGIAVSPWIEGQDLVTAVTASAQIKRFRSYSSVKQKLMYRKGRNPEEDNTNTFAQEVATLGGKCQILSNRVDNILTYCLTNETNMKKSSESLHKVEAGCVRLKRQIDQRALAHPCFKLRKTKPFFSLSRAYAYLQKYGDSVKIDLFNALSSGSKLMFNVPHIGHTSLHRGDEIGNCQKHEENADTVNNGATCISYVNLLEPQGKTENSKDHGTCKSCAYVRVDVKYDSSSSFPQPSPSKLLLKYVPEDQIEKKVCFKEKYKENTQIQSKDSDQATSVAKNEKVNNISVEEKDRENVSVDTADLSLNSQSDQQPESLDYSCSRVLHMKLPKGYDLPSKELLIKKFRPYGPIDILNTKLFPYTGSARIVFLHHIDAVTAYEDAKEKALAAQLNVRFWLDPFDHKRGVNFLQPSSSAAKSCLKISGSLLKEEKKGRRVRFLPLPSSNLKSCLKVSSSIQKEKKKARRVRFIMRS